MGRRPGRPPFPGPEGPGRPRWGEEVSMSRGSRRAGSGQGAAAAVQLLVTLSFLPSVVEAQVSPSDGEAGTPAERPRRPRTGRGWGAGRGPAPDREGGF